MSNPTPIPQAVGAAAVPATPSEREQTLAGLLKRCARCLPPEHATRKLATHYLQREGFFNPLRSASPSPASTSAPAEPVGEIVLFGGDLKEVSWRKGKMPAPGTKLYAGAPDAAPAGEPTADQPDVLSLLQRARLYTSARPTGSEASPFAAFRSELDAAIAALEQSCK